MDFNSMDYHWEISGWGSLKRLEANFRLSSEEEREGERIITTKVLAGGSETKLVVKPNVWIVIMSGNRIDGVNKKGGQPLRIPEAGYTSRDAECIKRKGHSRSQRLKLELYGQNKRLSCSS